MLTLQDGKIKACKYKVSMGGATIYTNAVPDGAEFEEVDVSGEMFLDGAECPDIQTAHEWLALGYIPKTQEEILQETVDMLVLSMLEG